MPFAIPYADRTLGLLRPPATVAESAPYEASQSVRVAVQDALRRGETHYTDRPGILPLRQKIATSLSGRFRITIEPKNDMIVTCGVTEARFVAIQQLLKPDDVIAAPALSERIIGASILGRVQLATTIEPSASLVYLSSSTSKAELSSSLAQAPPTALILFEIDELDSNFHPSQIAGFADRTVTIGSLGDTTWRLGYLASPGNFSPSLRDFKQALTICSTNLSQWAALAFEEQS